MVFWSWLIWLARSRSAFGWLVRHMLAPLWMGAFVVIDFIASPLLQALQLLVVPLTRLPDVVRQTVGTGQDTHGTFGPKLDGYFGLDLFADEVRIQKLQNSQGMDSVVPQVINLAVLLSLPGYLMDVSLQPHHLFEVLNGRVAVLDQ